MQESMIAGKVSCDVKGTEGETSPEKPESKSDVQVHTSAELAQTSTSHDARPASVLPSTNGIGFRAVDPFDLHIRHLSLAVAQPEQPRVQKWASKLARRAKRKRSVKEMIETTDVEKDPECLKTSPRSTAGRPTTDILKDISADLPSGSLTAILGSSGSGKTTLLSVLAGRLRGSSYACNSTLLPKNEDASTRRTKAYKAGCSDGSRGGSGLRLSGSKRFVASHGSASAGAGAGARISSAATPASLAQPSSSASKQSASRHEVTAAYVTQQDVLLPALTVRETLRYAADLRLTGLCRRERQDIVEQVILELGLKDAADTKIGSSTRNGCSGGEKRRTSIGVQV